MNRKLKNIISEILIFLLVSVLALSCLIACNPASGDEHGSEQGKDGQDWGKDPSETDREHEEITESGYAEALYAIIEDVVKKKISQDLPQVLATMEATSKQADALLKKALYDNDEYIALRDIFVRSKAELVNAAINIADDNSTDADVELLYSIILDYYDIMGKDNFAGFIYDMVLYELEYDYNDRDRVDRDIGTKRESTDEAFNDWQDFKSDVSKKDFSNFLNNTILVFELLNEKKTDAGSFELTDAEMADLIKKPDFTCNIKVKGWRVIVKKIGSFFNSDTFFGMVYAKAHDSVVPGSEEKGADLDVIASKMNNIVAIAQFAQSRITASDVSLLRDDLDGYIVSLIKNMAKEEGIWAKVEDLASTRFYYDYNKVSAEYFLNNDKAKYDDFVNNYSKNAPTATAAELKVVSKENLHMVLEGIVASISPAFSYEMYTD